MQLWSIHVFIANGESFKLVPALFVLMSGQVSGAQQKCVGTLLRAKLPKYIAMDFESAVWNAFRDIVPSVDRKGCHLQRTQAIWRKVQELGLAVTYTSLFTNMTSLDTPNSPMPPLLCELLNYIHTNWIYINKGSVLWGKIIKG